MRANLQPVLRDIVLIGGGHSHVGVLRHFAMHPVPGARLTLVCKDSHGPYSGMLPGYIAGHYSYDDVHIDLRRLAEWAGARFFKDEVTAIDSASQSIICRDRPAVSYDIASINIGATPQTSYVKGADEWVTPVKPISQFNARWLSLLSRVQSSTDIIRIAVVGGGAGGIELALAIQFRLAKELTLTGRPTSDVQYHLFTRGDDVLSSHPARVRARFRKVLAARDIQLHRDQAISEVVDGRLRSTSGEEFEADEVLWVTQAGAAPWLKQSGFEVDDDGFMLVNEYLQCMNHENIFAVGDVAAMVSSPRAKAGVFAVRQAKPLAENIVNKLKDLPLKAYHPQKHWLALISTGDQFAVASRGGFSWAGRWIWRLKDRIDRKFMQQYSDLPAMEDRKSDTHDDIFLSDVESEQVMSTMAMRCGGCGAKVSGDVLGRVLVRLGADASFDVKIGLSSPDDAAVVMLPEGMAAVHTVDFFRAFVDDPWLLGKIATTHALSDLYAMAATPHTALAIVAVPQGLDAKVEEMLFQVMAGASEVLEDADCTLVGGHSGEGQELAFGISANGWVDPDKILRKGNMQPGDALILTKALGTGTLLAAHTQLKAKGRWVDAAISSMCMSNKLAVAQLLAHDVNACTDITGFGLVGHSLEMLRASNVDLELFMDLIPVLPGAVVTAHSGILSSLHSGNLQVRTALYDGHKSAEHPHFPLLFDPQTSGGLLASVPAIRADECIAALKAVGYVDATIVGKVSARSTRDAPIALI